MIQKSIMTVMVMCSLLFINTSDVLAQNNNKNKKEQKNKEYKKGDHNKTKDYQKVKGKQKGKKGDVVGYVVLPRTGAVSPRKLKGVPKGHYPPPGSCKIWYPNRPPGHQPAATSCSNVYRTKLEPGAFILHGDRAYDADYNWKEEERRRPGTVSVDILDILFGTRR